MFMPFHALGVEDANFICHSAPALSVAIWVRSLSKQPQFLLAQLCYTVRGLLRTPYNGSS